MFAIPDLGAEKNWILQDRVTSRYIFVVPMEKASSFKAHNIKVKQIPTDEGSVRNLEDVGEVSGKSLNAAGMYAITNLQTRVKEAETRKLGPEVPLVNEMALEFLR
ncbi:hypothetical protein PHYPSEUDO_005089 [Phytophthora pseudosyringae]|uniref:Uncharacterized protein n=1 Tax=Phytophthora pseudosyringae TaxID=221518 RepID=A0A8T1VLU4_9STRA|nr:hypothetical protein PHYPSEUDO_005089 [Phytophthora pseudosyringae]